MANKRLPSLFYNPLSMFGGTAALVSFCVILFLVLLDVFSHGTSPYMGILAFIIMPAVLVLGLILIPIGMKWERNRRLKMTAGEPRSFYIDFGKRSHRTAAMIFLVGSIVFFCWPQRLAVTELTNLPNR